MITAGTSRRERHGRNVTAGMSLFSVDASTAKHEVIDRSVK